MTTKSRDRALESSSTSKATSITTQSVTVVTSQHVSTDTSSAVQKAPTVPATSINTTTPTQHLTSYPSHTQSKNEKFDDVIMSTADSSSIDASVGLVHKVEDVGDIFSPGKESSMPEGATPSTAASSLTRDHSKASSVDVTSIDGTTASVVLSTGGAGERGPSEGRPGEIIDAPDPALAVPATLPIMLPSDEETLSPLGDAAAVLQRPVNTMRGADSPQLLPRREIIYDPAAHAHRPSMVLEEDTALLELLPLSKRRHLDDFPLPPLRSDRVEADASIAAPGSHESVSAASSGKASRPRHSSVAELLTPRAQKPASAVVYPPPTRLLMQIKGGDSCGPDYMESAAALVHSNGCVYFGHGNVLYEYPLFHQFVQHPLELTDHNARASEDAEGQGGGVRVLAVLAIPPSEAVSPPSSPSSGGSMSTEKGGARGGQPLVYIHGMCALANGQGLLVVLRKESRLSQGERNSCSLTLVSLEGQVTPIPLPPECCGSLDSVASLGDSGHFLICTDDLWHTKQQPPLWLGNLNRIGRWVRLKGLTFSEGTVSRALADGWATRSAESLHSWAHTSELLDRKNVVSSGDVLSTCADEASMMTPTVKSFIAICDRFSNNDDVLLVVYRSLPQDQGIGGGVGEERVATSLLRASLSMPHRSTLQCSMMYTSYEISDLRGSSEEGMYSRGRSSMPSLSRQPSQREWHSFKISRSSHDVVYGAYAVKTPTGVTAAENLTHVVVRLPSPGSHIETSLENGGPPPPRLELEMPVRAVSGFWGIGSSFLVTGVCKKLIGGAGADAGDSSNDEDGATSHRILLCTEPLPLLDWIDPLQSAFPPHLLCETQCADICMDCCDYSQGAQPRASLRSDDQAGSDGARPTLLPAHSVVLCCQSTRLKELILQARREGRSSLGWKGSVREPTQSPERELRLVLPCHKQTLQAFREYLYTQELPVPLHTFQRGEVVIGTSASEGCKALPRVTSMSFPDPARNIFSHRDISMRGGLGQFIGSSPAIASKIVNFARLPVNLHLTMAELLVLASVCQMPMLSLQSEEILSALIQPSTVADIYAKLERGLMAIESPASSPSSVPLAQKVDVTPIVDLLRKCTSVAVQYLWSVEKFQMLHARDGAKPACTSSLLRTGIRDALYERFEAEPEVFRKWRAVVRDPTCAEHVVESLSRYLERVRLHRSHWELRQLGTVFSCDGTRGERARD